MQKSLAYYTPHLVRGEHIVCGIIISELKNRIKVIDVSSKKSIVMNHLDLEEHCKKPFETLRCMVSKKNRKRKSRCPDVLRRIK